MAQYGGTAYQQGAHVPSIPSATRTLSPLPRVHGAGQTRTRAITPTSTTTTTAAAAMILGTGTTSSSVRGSTVSSSIRRLPSEVVSLAQPRPNVERTVNEYVETPFRSDTLRVGVVKSRSDPHHNNDVVSVGTGGIVRGTDGRHSGRTTGTNITSTSSTLGLPRRGVTGPTSTSQPHHDGGNHHHPHHQTLQLPISNKSNSGSVQRSHNARVKPTSLPVTKQPGSVTFKKDVPGTIAVGSGVMRGTDSSGECFSRGSIICPECGRCRCESCRQPRPLPSRWLCNNGCYCSAETTLDYASCLCCIKGLFYHCSKDYELDREGASCADDPCSCGPHRRCMRWGCMGVLSLVLPCLWCYWPLRACLGVCEKCYENYSSSGCRCEPRDKALEVTPEKRLLDSSPDF